MLNKNKITENLPLTVPIIDRLILGSWFDLELTLHKITRNVFIAYGKTVSHAYVSNIIQKYMIIMAKENQKEHNRIAPLIKNISSDELHCKKYDFKCGVLYSTHDVKSGYTISAYFNPHKDNPTKEDWVYNIKHSMAKGLDPETMTTDLGKGIYNSHELYGNCYHFADSWHVIDKMKKIKVSLENQLKKAKESVARVHKKMLILLNPKITPKAYNKLLNDMEIEFTQEQIDELQKAYDHIDISIELFYGYILRPNIATPYRLDQAYDQIMEFIEEAIPLYPSKMFVDNVAYLKRNKAKIIAFAFFIQDKFIEEYQQLRHLGVSFSDLWQTIAIRQYNKKHIIRINAMKQLEEKYSPEIIGKMLCATNAIFDRLKLTSQITEGYHTKIAGYARKQKTMSQTKMDAIIYHINHKVMPTTACKSRRGKSYTEIVTGKSQPDWLDTITGATLNPIKIYAVSEHNKMESLAHQMAA